MKLINWLWNWIPKLFKRDVKLPDIKDIKPVEPVEPDAVGCGCDLSKPLECPYVPDWGATEGEVDKYLREGKAAEAGGTGMPIDVRFRLDRPGGNYWCVADFAKSGLVTYRDGKLTANCGPYRGKMWHPYYMSAHNQGVHMEGVKVVSGQAVPRNGLTFVYYEARGI